MNSVPRKVILDSGVLSASSDLRSYRCQSTIFSDLIGVGKTAEDACANYRSIVNEFYLGRLEQDQGKKNRGRPSKGNIDFHCQIRKEIKEEINTLAQTLCCSQGEAVEVLMNHYRIWKQCSQEDRKLIVKNWRVNDP